VAAGVIFLPAKIGWYFASLFMVGVTAPPVAVWSPKILS
jgi:hypothetical protein